MRNQDSRQSARLKRNATANPIPSMPAEERGRALLSEPILTPLPADSHITWIWRTLICGLLLLVVTFVLGPLVQESIARQSRAKVDPVFVRYTQGAAHKAWRAKERNAHLVTFSTTPALLLIDDQEYELYVDSGREGCGRLFCSTIQSFVGTYRCEQQRITGESMNLPALLVTFDGGEPDRLTFDPCQ